MRTTIQARRIEQERTEEIEKRLFTPSSSAVEIDGENISFPSLFPLFPPVHSVMTDSGILFAQDQKVKIG